MTFLPFAHRIRITRRDIGELLVAADLGVNLPGARTFAPLSRLEEDGDTFDVIEPESIGGPLALDELGVGCDRHLGYFDVFQNRQHRSVGDMDLRRGLER